MDNYQVFNRQQWAQLRANTPLLLSEQDIAKLSGVNEPVSIDDIQEIFLPLSRLLNLHVKHAQLLRQSVQQEFFNQPIKKIPFIIGVAGSVAVGKSTFSRLLQRTLQCWEDHPQVALVPTDGFLFDNAQLKERNLMDRKGFPESYDVAKMIDFLVAAKSGTTKLNCSVYSHEIYDILPNEQLTIDCPDILIIEGLNVLQSIANVTSMASDYFDFSVYIDADEKNIEQWYVQRFLTLQQTVFSNPDSFFHHFQNMSKEKASLFAASIWEQINLVNLRQNIIPSKQRARLIVHKDVNHQINKISLRHF